MTFPIFENMLLYFSTITILLFYNEKKSKSFNCFQESVGFRLLGSYVTKEKEGSRVFLTLNLKINRVPLIKDKILVVQNVFHK